MHTWMGTHTNTQYTFGNTFCSNEQGNCHEKYKGFQEPMVQKHKRKKSYENQK